MSHRVVALIGARSGSERVPGKNVRRLAGHPLLAYAIETARQSGVFERIVVSTDSEEIAKVARWYGADVPFLRPDEYATATSPDIEWIAWTLPRLEERYDLFAIVRATNPFRGPDTIRRGLEQLLATPEADSIRAVERVKQHPGKMWELTIDGRTMLPLLDQSHLDVAWHAGQYQALPPGLRPEQRARDRLDTGGQGDRDAGGARARAVPDGGPRGPQHRRRGRLRLRGAARRGRPGDVAGGRARPVSRASVSHPIRVWSVAVVATLVALCLFGITTSSLADAKLSETPGHYAPGLVTGEPRAIRADEYRRSTPWQLGLIARGSEAFATPLAYPDVALVATSTRGPAGVLLHPEAVLLTAGNFLPAEMLFAFVWWLPVGIVALLLPFWLTRLGVTPGIALSATALVLLAPTVHWWSWWSLGVLAAPLVSAVLVLWGFARWAARGANVLSLAAFAVAALGVARAAVGYAPWTIPLTATILVPTLAWLLTSERRRLALASLGGTVLAGAALAGVLLAQSGALEVIEETVYPGSRRSLGEFVGLDLLFGAPHLWILQAPPLIVGTNASELATGYLVLAIPAVAMAVGVRWRDVGRVRAPAAAAGAVAALMATWLVVDWPGFFSWLFPMTLVPPERMAQVVGLSATIAFAFVLTAWCAAPRLRRMPVAAVSAVLAGVATILGGLELRDALPELPAWVVVIVGVLVALAILAVVWHPASPRALAVMPVLALVVVFAANPLQRGLGDLRGSTAAETVSAASDRLGDGEYLAADSLEVDALLMSNGVPALSGQQWLGPDEEAWRVLDPSGRSRFAWNRGASYVVFDWATGEQTTIRALAEDIVQVRTDPCGDGVRALGLRVAASSRPLDAACLEEVGRFHWGATEQRLYAVGRG